MRNTDISKYNDDSASPARVSAKTVAGEIFGSIGKLLITLVLVMLITGIVLLISILFYIADIASEPQTINLSKMKLNQTSHVFVLNDSGEWEDYRQLYATENRVWVSYNEIPKHMIDAQIAIEDKRFYEHNGVDWYRTGGAVYSLATGQNDFGGSTITQQLIKNITDDNEVSITRKLREIFRALKLEQEYSKDDIIEAYLNIVNYGSGCRGVQSAARLYFNKDIQDCTIAECAAIAGITQNPYKFDPLVYPEYNKERRETVLDEMYEQEMITKEEYDEAMEESENMTFVGYYEDDDDDEDDTSDWNWYDDRLFRDVSNALSEELHISLDLAENMIYNEGLCIYSAMDKDAQEAAEKLVLEWKTPDDPTLDIGYIMMDFEGRIICTVGGRQIKDGRLLWDNASQSSLQPGSTIKPLATYALALEDKKINFSSLIDDSPQPSWRYSESEGAIPGPNNWYGTYYGNITVTRALNISSNAATVNVLKSVGTERSYNFLTEQLNFQHLDEEDRENIPGLALGGFVGGATVEEMTASYEMFCNGGYYYEPYSYYYVTDSDGEVLLDNRDRGKPDQVISAETATIMNRLLSEVVNSGDEALGYRTKIDGWDIIGKTGTTDSSYDNWFVGASPYAVAGIWTGHSTPSKIAESEQSAVHYLWRDIMAAYLKDKPNKAYDLQGDVQQHNYMKDNGKLVTYDAGSKMAVGYYTSDNMPDYYKVETSKPSSSSRGEDDDEDDDEDDEESEGEEESEESENEDDEESSTDEESEESEESEEESSEPEEDESSEEESIDDGEESSQPEESVDGEDSEVVVPEEPSPEEPSQEVPVPPAPDEPTETDDGGGNNGGDNNGGGNNGGGGAGA